MMLWALPGAHAASIGLSHLVQLLGHRGDALQAVWLHNVGVLDAHSAYSWQHIFWLMKTTGMWNGLKVILRITKRIKKHV